MTLVVNDKIKQPIIPTPFYFFGLKHCGKSTLGRLAAQALKMDFLDADDILSNYLENIPGYESISIRELFRSKGKAIFQEYEYLSLAENLKRKMSFPVSTCTAGLNYIYALGGGACDNILLLRFLKRTMGTFFYIKQDEKVLLHRILQRGIPPFLDKENPEESFHKLYTARSKIYHEKADYIIDISGTQPINESVHMILSFLKRVETKEQK